MLICSIVSDSLQPHGLQPTSLLCPWNFPGKITGMGCHFLLQGIFPTQGSNLHLLCLLHWQADSLPLHHLGSLNILNLISFKVTLCQPSTLIKPQILNSYLKIEDIKLINTVNLKFCFFFLKFFNVVSIDTGPGSWTL